MEDHYGDSYMDVHKFKWLVVFALLIAFGCSKSEPVYVSGADWPPTISVSLGLATLANETAPDVVPDDSPAPHPDVDKCACKGTGFITHGDGHKTPCPYHAKSAERASCKCDTKSTYCNCKNKYGACHCNKQTEVMRRRRPFMGLFDFLFGVK